MNNFTLRIEYNRIPERNFGKTKFMKIEIVMGLKKNFVELII